LRRVALAVSVASMLARRYSTGSCTSMMPVIHWSDPPPSSTCGLTCCTNPIVHLQHKIGAILVDYHSCGQPFFSNKIRAPVHPKPGELHNLLDTCRMATPLHGTKARSVCTNVSRLRPIKWYVRWSIQ
jgi:hypothetical protein